MDVHDARGIDTNHEITLDGEQTDEVTDMELLTALFSRFPAPEYGVDMVTEITGGYTSGDIDRMMRTDAAAAEKYTRLIFFNSLCVPRIATKYPEMSEMFERQERG